jgi:uncharacterized cupredoxin-like copper-binding protein
MRRLFALTLIATLAVVGAACGDDDEGASGAGADGEVIEIDMVDNAYAPSEVEVPAGEEVTFRFANTGTLMHEAYIGDDAMQAEHEATMQEQAEMGDMGGTSHGSEHGDADVLEVESGEDGDLTYTFDEPGDYVIGCHQPGHYDDGMKMRVTAV